MKPLVNLVCTVEFFCNGFVCNVNSPNNTDHPEVNMHWIHCIENFFHRSGFLSNLRLPLKPELTWKFSLYWKYFLSFRIFEQLALALKNRVCPEIFHSIEYTFYIQDFWATCVCPKNQSCPENFHCIEIFFIIQDFWATCASAKASQRFAWKCNFQTYTLASLCCLFLGTWKPTLQQSQLHFCTKQIMAVLWSLTCAAVKLSLFQENKLSNSIPHRVKCPTEAVNHLSWSLKT